MITGEIKPRVERIWDTLCSGRISKPFAVIAQLTYLLLIKRLDELHTGKENKASRFRKSSALCEQPFSSLHADGSEGLFAGKPSIIDGLFHKLEETLPRVMVG